ncbi:hypothetical protein VTN77DRAFT_5917 [Rasamsonia byssochlamydoides]|uniref:uncharacterized protein n=1 Tax=Rasamsonia byssochlamydoides TaxID=89139 RepID=UPI0037428F4D
MTGPRQLHIYSKGLGSTSYYVLDSDKQTCLYTLREKRLHWTSGPDIEIFRNKDRPELKDRPVEVLVGAVHRHTFSTNLDVYIRNQPVTLSSNGVYSGGGLSYVSLRPGVGTLTWKREGMFSESMRLVQQQLGGGRVTVARLESVRLAMSKIGRLEVWDSHAGDGVLDEIVVTGLAVMLENRRRRSSGTTAVAAAGAGAGA